MQGYSCLWRKHLESALERLRFDGRFSRCATDLKDQPLGGNCTYKARFSSPMASLAVMQVTDGCAPAGAGLSTGPGRQFLTVCRNRVLVCVRHSQPCFRSPQIASRGAEISFSMMKVTVTEPLDISIVVPAYNEESRIEQVLRNLRPLAREVVVVDDASADRTASVAMREGAIVIRNDAQLGYLGAIARGFKSCHPARDCGD